VAGAQATLVSWTLTSDFEGWGATLAVQSVPEPDSSSAAAGWLLRPSCPIAVHRVLQATALSDAESVPAGTGGSSGVQVAPDPVSISSPDPEVAS
jgi:hypothetical protein